MGFYNNLASTSSSIAMIGTFLSFVGVGFFLLILSERIFHGLSKLILFFGNQILIARRLFSKKYIEENKASKNQLHIKQKEIILNEASLAEKKEWLEKILKIKSQLNRTEF